MKDSVTKHHIQQQNQITSEKSWRKTLTMKGLSDKICCSISILKKKKNFNLNFYLILKNANDSKNDIKSFYYYFFILNLL